MQRSPLIENVALDAVHTADWEKSNGKWRPIPMKGERIGELSRNWQLWQEEWKEVALFHKWGDQVSSMIENVGRAVDFGISYSGSQSNRWRVIFEYKQAFVR